MIDTSVNSMSKQGGQEPQYSVRQILTLWAAVTLPMVLLAWLVAPVLSPRLGLPAAIGYWLVLLPGMIWQCALALWLLRRETGTLRWEAICSRIGLAKPRHPHSGEQHTRLLWRAVPSFLLMTPVILLEGLAGLGLLFIVLRISRSDILVALARQLRGYTQLIDLIDPSLAGRWDALVFVMLGWLFSAYLSEELFFRGVLLPRMGGKWSWLGNAALYSLYYLHRPWAVPFRFVEAILIARPTQRLHSIWLAVIVRGAEGAMLLAMLLGIVTAPKLAPLQADVQLPYIMHRPESSTFSAVRGSLDEIPHYQGDASNPMAVDLRGYDISHLGLRNSLSDLEYAVFDTQTRWPSTGQMPPGFDPTVILETGKNPGLSVRGLHERGITGRGVGIAIIDQPLLTGHREYADRLMWYEDIYPFGTSMAEMHGPAVSSIALGKTVGVAPEADLYYFNIGSGISGLDFHYHARAIRRVLEINHYLPRERQIRVISLSTGWLPQYMGYDDMVDAVTEAEAAGLLVLEVDSHGLMGLGRHPNTNPDDFATYEPGVFWAENYYDGNWVIKDMLLVPMDSRTVAGSGSSDEYTFGRMGGMSWAVPYLAGVYALAVQADPDITPEHFWALAYETGRSIEVEHDGTVFSLETIIDPPALIAALQAGQ
ncbi:MAG: CPBP family intramembrane metalloprotease [Anaerolineae bacterium]|nr:CPBP family intramembrane metalloprotease [Anaerolineae bacterium]